MFNFFKPVFRHIAAAAVGALAGLVTAKTGVAFPPETTEPIIAAATIGVYGAVNHGIKAAGTLLKKK